MFQQMFYQLLEQVIALSNSQKKDSGDQQIYAIDATVISLTLSLFDWAHYRTRK